MCVPFSRFTVALALVASLRAVGASAADLMLDVALDPATRRLEATAELDAPGDFIFALHESLTVRSVTVAGLRVTPARTRTGALHTWRVTAPQGARLRIRYRGTLPALDPAIDHRGVLRKLGPMASTAGTFLPAGAGWYPRPRALFSYSVRLLLPGAQRGLVPGRLASESLPYGADERYVARFEFEEPAEGIDLMAGPYVVREKRLAREAGRELRLRTYFFRGMEALADGYLEDTGRYIDLYSGAIGPYPFDGFSIVASPLPTGFGMAGVTYIGARVLKLPFIRATSLGHEVLHNWWGNGVYVDYASGNWSEGLTTFMADYTYKERESAAAARDMRLAWLRDFAAVPSDARRPLSAFRSRTHGADAAVGYNKAAMLFFMLREALGADTFERAVKAFWTQYRFRTAAWADLRRAFEQASGRSLEAFFEQWLTRPGAPRVRIDSARAQAWRADALLRLVVVQSAPAYTLQLPFEVVYGTRSEARVLDVNRAEQAVTVRVPEMPRGVRVDPEFRVWRELEPSELPPILRQWIVAAAPRLAIVSTHPGVPEVAQALARDFFEGPPREPGVDDPAVVASPLLLVGLDDDVDAALARRRLPPRPTPPLTRGSAEVWTIESTRGAAPVAVISARDTQSLKAIARALPHHGAQSWLVFEGSKVIARGVWPGQTPIVEVQVAR